MWGEISPPRTQTPLKQNNDMTNHETNQVGMKTNFYSMASEELYTWITAHGGWINWERPVAPGDTDDEAEEYRDELAGIADSVYSAMEYAGK